MSEKMFVGCGDNSCVFEKPTGMGTNGGCQCLKGRPFEERRRLTEIARRWKASEARWEILDEWLYDLECSAEDPEPHRIQIYEVLEKMWELG